MPLPAQRTSPHRLIAGMCFTLAATGVNAETTGPSFDCAKASSQAEDLICADAALATLDRRLALRFGAALEAAGNIEDDTENARTTLRAMQRGWIKGRDECWKAQDVRGCVERDYLTREGQLVAAWMLETPLATVTYTCEDNPANEVTAYFFDTELPSIRVEYGDSVAVGSLEPAASGSRYAIEFGGIFWTKGDSAVFEWRAGDPMSCTAITR
ncbi:DUF1311 domain-containing protein [Roseobacter denitrificans]|uniref:C-type lysozyme inhibitor domain-containing protein n=1 Tax=Roseobacter denitrificans (strain ATCC 33942 / OCh 114) TaxID=375451 RepID=Q16AK2_ROSDO|nr:MliC family protein [Roseobacter denitrificans]ABG30991.1 conserved hypothetical protein [Roseobacter denitrificans OCh 114]AVL54071.1 DUF1311 domain-containing protein [Roseobacter denitrificans]SFG12938.1 Protein of unknown function [Roseobacter denitrificans OCh 114]